MPIHRTRPSKIPGTLVLVILLASCNVDVTLTRIKTGTVEGDETLHKVGVTLHQELLNPIEVHKPHKARKLDTINVDHVTLSRTTDELPEGDHDDLLFIRELKIVVEPVDSTSYLIRRKIAWYNRDEAATPDPYEINLEIDPDINVRPYILQGCRFILNSVYEIPEDDISISIEAVFIGIHNAI
jgi:hypothetical protein